MYSMLILLPLWWACLHVCSVESAESPAPFVNKTMLFVSGWPQSGTSLVQQILTVTPGMSTMVAKCRKVHGAKCNNWNNEGQWLAERSNEVSPYLQPGKMCPSVGDKLTPPTESVNSLSDQWMRYWDMSQPILVEKSPQSMLKMPMLANMFRSAKKLKFLVVLKHPATLNVATPADMSWLTNTREHSEAAMRKKVKSRVSPAYSSSGNGAVEATFNTDAEIVDSVHFFLHFMGHHEVQASGYTSGQSSTVCSSLGWIPGMEHLMQQLREMKVSHPHVDIRVVRFEHFQKPYFLCKAVNAFALDLSYAEVEHWEQLSAQEQRKSEKENVANYKAYSSAVSAVCDVHFKPAAVGKVSQASTLDDQGRGVKTFRARKASPTAAHRHQRRMLAAADDGIADADVDVDARDAGDGSVDVKVDDDDAFEEARTRAEQDAGTLDEHGSAELPLLPMKQTRGRLRTSHHKAYLELLNAAHASKHTTRVKRAKLLGSRLQKDRKRASNVAPRRRSKKNAKTRESKPRTGARSGGGSRRRLRLKEQEQAGRGLDFRPEIVSKTLRLRLAEFHDMLVRKAELLNRSAYTPPPTGGNIKSNISHSSFMFHDPLHRKTLTRMLTDVDAALRRYGYGLLHNYTPFFSEPTELDDWDIMKQWKRKQN